MSQSLFISNKHENKELEESRLDLLKSLERITSL